MKILLVHNYYRSRSPSGEDIAFNNEKQLLKSKGLEIATFERNNDAIEYYSFLRKSSLFFQAIYSREAYREIKSILNKWKPDIVHFHNIFYLLTPSVYYACKDFGASVVQSLHNFRFFCANGLLLRKGEICEECIGKLPWRSVFYGCFKDSAFYSTPIALLEILYSLFGTWNKKVDAYIASTGFSRKKFIECGLPMEKIFVKPNLLSSPPAPNFSNKGFAMFLGRLSPEKGLNTLFDAFNILESKSINSISLKVVGDGPLRNHLEGKVKIKGRKDIELLGRISLDKCMKLLKDSKFLIIPSLCYENFPMVLLEAYACGKPVIASRLGAMQEIVEDGKTGLLFNSGSAEDLAAKISWMYENEEECLKMGKNAIIEFEEKYTSEKNFQKLMNIYEKALK